MPHPNATQTTNPTLIRHARDTDARAVLDLLALDHHLELAFDPAQFWVTERDQRIVACARLKPLGGTEWEIASVVVHPDSRGRDYGAVLVRHVLATARGTVYALALAPGFFAKLGFAALAEVPPSLVGKATSVCASSGFVPMELRR